MMNKNSNKKKTTQNCNAYRIFTFNYLIRTISHLINVNSVDVNICSV